MKIETNRFLLKKVERKYLKNIYRMLSDPEVIQNLNMKLHKSLADTDNLLNEYEEGFKKQEKYPFEILDKKTNEFIGIFLIKLDYYDEDCFELTIYLDKKFWGNGVYSEILPYMEKFAFENIHTNNIRGFVKEKNIISRYVLEKLGYKLEKIFEVENIEGKIYSYLKTRDKN